MTPALSQFQFAALILTLFSGTTLSHAATGSFNFRPFLNGDVLDNQTAGTVTDGPFQMQATASPTGAIFDVRTNGMGVNSSVIPNVTDDDFDKISVTGGSDPNASGISETMSFSFNRDGILQDLYLDGLKDENLEYAILTLPDNSTISIFDFEVPDRLAEQGFDLSDLTAPNIVLGSDDDPDDDNVFGLGIPFLSGQTFTLTFAVEPAPMRIEGNQTITYVPTSPQAPNGYRVQQITVVPEPASLTLLMAALLVCSSRTARN